MREIQLTGFLCNQSLIHRFRSSISPEVFLPHMQTLHGKGYILTVMNQLAVSLSRITCHVTPNHKEEPCNAKGRPYGKAT
jgi:hypothetical protein